MNRIFGSVYSFLENKVSIKIISFTPQIFTFYIASILQLNSKISSTVALSKTLLSRTSKTHPSFTSDHNGSSLRRCRGYDVCPWIRWQMLTLPLQSNLQNSPTRQLSLKGDWCEWENLQIHWDKANNVGVPWVESLSFRLRNTNDCTGPCIVYLYMHVRSYIECMFRNQHWHSLVNQSHFPARISVSL